uniref:E1_dh domain-containing protein n=1 Tax=Rhabditophanes sp. KR3021 TaxID=114890 RepID=A0AC35TP24_9BILA
MTSMDANSLICSEIPDERMEMDLCSDPVSGAKHFIKQIESNKESTANEIRLLAELTTEEAKLANELGQLTTNELLEFVRNLQNRALQLSKDEAFQFARGHVLGIFREPETEPPAFYETTGRKQYWDKKA